MTINVNFESHNFPKGTINDGWAVFTTSWDDILWAALTVGRPNRSHVFQHGDSSLFEAIFRMSLIRMALEQTSGSHPAFLRRTMAARTLDPSEKGAVSYFLGMTFCKLFAAHFLNTPWLLHLDVFRPSLDHVLTGRSRPDLVGQVANRDEWHAFECKGRVSRPDEESRRKAKEQSERLVSVNGIDCSLHVGAVTYFYHDTLEFYWRDPLPDSELPLKCKLGESAWEHYYSAVAALYFNSPMKDNKKINEISRAGTVGLEMDINIDIHPTIAKLLRDEKWNKAHDAARSMTPQLIQEGYKPDGIAIHSGSTWKKRFKEPLRK